MKGFCDSVTIAEVTKYTDINGHFCQLLFTSLMYIAEHPKIQIHIKFKLLFHIESVG